MISLPKIVHISEIVVGRGKTRTHYSLLTRPKKPWRSGITHHFRVKQGFTLIELLVVIGILTVLFAIVLIAVNPGRQFAQANNTQRRSDANAILNAIHQYGASNKGVLPAGIDTTERTICFPTSVTCPAATSVDICAALVPTYLADLPLDPQTGTKAPANSVCTAATAYDTQYTVQSTGPAGGNRITVRAPDVELSEVITVTR